MNIRLLRFSLLFFIALAGCAPSPEALQTAVQGTLAALPTFTPLPSLTPAATYTPLPTYTLYPSLTPTIADTPTPEGTPTETLNPHIAIHPPGNYLVNVDISFGNWRSMVQGIDDCYWKVNDRFGKIINNELGFSGGVMYIPMDAFEVSMSEECGDWEFLGIPVR